MTALLHRPVKDKKKSVKTPMSVGEKLFSTRRKKNLDLLEVERKTLIRAKYLEALEQSKFYQLPLPVYAQGFVQTYATFLGLNPKRMLSQFQAEYGAANRSSVAQIVLDTTLHPARVLVTPRVLWRGFSAALICLLIAYFGVQIAHFAGVPSLTLESPAQQAEVTTDSVVVAGLTDPGVLVHIGNTAIPVSEDGHFTVTVHVNQGVNTINVNASNRLGKTRMQSRVVKVTTASTALLTPAERDHGQN